MLQIPTSDAVSLLWSLEFGAFGEFGAWELVFRSHRNGIIGPTFGVLDGGDEQRRFILSPGQSTRIAGSRCRERDFRPGTSVSACVAWCNRALGSTPRRRRCGLERPGKLSALQRGPQVRRAGGGPHQPNARPPDRDKTLANRPAGGRNRRFRCL